MAYYRRMGSMEEHLGGNAMSIASLRYQLRDLWRSPRGTVLRIEALALVAISLSFFLALFGSCRRWSNHWIVQKGFIAAQVLSLSLGTYSIGLMQSSPVKSEMYPIWAVCLLTLFGCIDPVTTNIDHDYKGPLTKMIFQLFLYIGYVMLIGVSTISSDIGKLAIGVLSIITFIKGFHRSLAFILPKQIRGDMDHWIRATEPAALAGDGKRLKVHLKMYLNSFKFFIQERDLTTMADIQKLRLEKGTPTNGITIEDVCLSYSFSHLLRERFLGLESPRKMEEKLMALESLVRDNNTTIDYKQALKVVEVELAFLFEAFFTSNEFLLFYQAKTSSFWALVSFIGICFVGVVAAIIPGEMASHHNIINSAAAATAGTSCIVNIVGTTVADLIITLVILVSLALLQLLQLIRCWTSNWARVGIACEYAIMEKKLTRQLIGWPYSDTICSRINQKISWWVMDMRLFLVARVNWFDKYLWQARLGQDSLVALLQRSRPAQDCTGSVLDMTFCGRFPGICLLWLHGVGFVYFCQVVGALLFSDSTNPGGAVRLHDDVKASTAEFLATIKSRRIGVEWSALFVENGLQDWIEYLPYTNTCGDERQAYAFARRVMIWHTATCYCEEAEKAAGGNGGGREDGSSREKNRCVAMDLSKYCFYLVVSAPELLPGPPAQTKQTLNYDVKQIQFDEGKTWLETMQQAPDAAFAKDMDPVKVFPLLVGETDKEMMLQEPDAMDAAFVKGVQLGKRLMTPPKGPGGRDEQEGEQSTRRRCSSDHWELLARLWVQTLLYAAPYGDIQAHMQRLAQGGEFITHLWALLFHLGIDKWEVAGIQELKAAAAEKGARRRRRKHKSTTTEVQARINSHRQALASSLSSDEKGAAREASREEAGATQVARKTAQEPKAAAAAETTTEVQDGINSHRQAPASSLSSDKKGAAGEASREEARGAVGELPREAGAAQVARKTAQEPREDEIEEVPN